VSEPALVLVPGDTTALPGDGDTTPLPGDGDTTPLPGDGDATPLPGDGDATPLPGDGATGAGVGTPGWTAVATGTGHTCGIREDGSLWCWGDGSHGTLGGQSSVDSSVPAPVGADQPGVWVALSTRDQHVCARGDDGSLWCGGDNSHGAVGDGTREPRESPTRVDSAQVWTSVSAGTHHTSAIREDGSLWCWGDNSHGQLGLPPRPVQVRWS
jgi:alpha-tubulin suppressor-like RCC1 family protein